MPSWLVPMKLANQMPSACLEFFSMPTASQTWLITGAIMELLAEELGIIGVVTTPASIMAVTWPA